MKDLVDIMRQGRYEDDETYSYDDKRSRLIDVDDLLDDLFDSFELDELLED